MEQARVVIVGAGPAGLVAGLSLAQQGIAVGLSSLVNLFATTTNTDGTMPTEHHFGEGK